MRQDSRHPPGRSNLASMNHDAKFQQVGVDGTGTRVHDIHVVVSDGFLNLDFAFPRWCLGDLSLGQGNTEAFGNELSQFGVT